MRDQLHRYIEPPKKPYRIISLVPSLSELMVDLGLETELVGVTKFCVHPQHLTSIKKIVGGTKQVDYDKIKALKPTIILCNKEENTPEMIAKLEGICTVHISDVNSVDECLELIQMYGLLFGVADKANELVTTLASKLKSFQSQILKEPRLNVVYIIWKKPWMVVGNETFINAMLSLNGFGNVYGNLSRYPEISLEDLPSTDVDVLMLSSEPYPFKEADILYMKNKFPNTKTVIVDGEMFSWYGSRLLKAFDYFTELRPYLK